MGTQCCMETSKLQKWAAGCAMLRGCSDRTISGAGDSGYELQDLRALGRWSQQAQHRVSQQRLEAPEGQFIPTFGGPGTQDGRLEGVLTVRPTPSGPGALGAPPSIVR